jgi:23S rRNA (uracil1939-C5)-methyltransferase
MTMRERRTHVPVDVGYELTVGVDALGSDGDGICRIEGYVVLVPGVLPGERVRVAIRSAARKFGRGELLEVVQPSPDRVAPRCAHFLACGGCHLQHLAYDAQLRHKRERLQRTLDRALGTLAPVVAPALAPPEPWGQRHKIAVHLGHKDGRLVPCFHRLRSADYVPIDQCPASDEDGFDRALAAVRVLDQCLARTQTTSPRLPFRSVLVRQSAGTGESHVVIVGDRQPSFLPAAAAAIRRDGATTVSWNQNDGPDSQLLGRTTTILFGPLRIEELVGDVRYLISPDTFFQTSPRAAAELVRTVCDWLAPGPADTVVDLFCGGGLFALPLARTARFVVGVEQHPVALGDARAASAHNGIDNVELVRGTAAEQVGRLGRELPRPDLAVLDPPRQGCGGAVVRGLARLGPARIAYVACDPDTLAADLAAFAAAGYRCTAAVAVDMFAQTCHVEAVALLAPAGPPAPH